MIHCSCVTDIAMLWSEPNTFDVATRTMYQRIIWHLPIDEPSLLSAVLVGGRVTENNMKLLSHYRRDTFYWYGQNVTQQVLTLIPIDVDD